MDWHLASEIFAQIMITLSHVVPYLIAMGAVFSVLSYVSPCNQGRPWWHKRGLVTDLCYWILVPVFTRYLRIGLTVMFTVLVFGIVTGEGIAAFYDHGHGPLSRLPFWTQLLIYLATTEFALYWAHRMFHRGFLWKYHAVHHAPKVIEWISASRFHPLNLALGTVAVDVIALLCGISSDVFLIMGPFNTITSVFVHANLDWSLGPFKYVFASPVFHRWHHAKSAAGKNFAGTFPFLDMMFGTFHMPAGELPSNYGIDDEAMPEAFMPQLVYPLLQKT